MKMTEKTKTDHTPITLQLKGRLPWTLMELVKAGDVGIIPLNNPRPRVPFRTVTLRSKGLAIDSTMQPHGGAFPNEYGVYFLNSSVTIELVEIHS
jgi:hypothetical protein